MLGAGGEELHVRVVDVGRDLRIVTGIERLDQREEHERDHQDRHGDREFAAEEGPPDGFPVGIAGGGDVLGFELVKGRKLKQIQVFRIHVYDLPAFSLSEIRGSIFVIRTSPSRTERMKMPENMNARAMTITLLYCRIAFGSILPMPPTE